MSGKAETRVVIADDDPEQLEHLGQMVRSLKPDWTICAQVSSMEDLQEAIDHYVPRVMILDIHLPPSGGNRNVLDLLKRLPYRTGVILVTGDPNFAVEAFELSVADYVIKPVKPSRLGLAMDRAFWGSGALAGGGEAPQQRSKQPRWVTACRGSDTVIVRTDDIIYFQSDRKYTFAFVASGQLLLRIGIGQVEGMLDPEQFSRIHRGTIVNLRHVEFARRDELGRLRLHLIGRQESLLVSRPFESLFKPL